MTDKVVIASGSDDRKGGNAASENDVAFSSDSLKRLKEGFEKTKMRAALIRQQIDVKVSKAKRTFICKECKKIFKTQKAVNKHWTSNKTGCTGAKGCTETIENALTIDDRLDPKELAIAQKIANARRAARDTAYRLSTKKSNEGLYDATRLMRYPIGNFERALHEAPTEELEKFIEMKFDTNTAPKKVMAMNELKLRKGKGA